MSKYLNDEPGMYVVESALHLFNDVSKAFMHYPNEGVTCSPQSFMALSEVAEKAIKAFESLQEKEYCIG